MVDRKLDRKARRRIKRFIQTGESQPRVRHVSDDSFDYRVKHYETVWHFKLKNSRLYKVESHKIAA